MNHDGHVVLGGDSKHGLERRIRDRVVLVAGIELDAADEPVADPLFHRKEVGSRFAAPAQAFDDGRSRVVVEDRQDLLDGRTVRGNFVRGQNDGMIDTAFVHFREQLLAVLLGWHGLASVVVVQMNMAVD